MCINCFKIAAGIALLENYFQILRLIPSSLTCSMDNKVSLGVPRIISA